MCPYLLTHLWKWFTMQSQPRLLSPTRSKALLPLTFFGCLVLVLLVLAVVGFSAFRSGSTGVKQAGGEAEQFLSDLERQNDQAGFNRMAEQTRRDRTMESMTDAMEVLPKRHGHPVSHRQLPGFYINTFNDVTSVRLAYQETFEKGEMPVQIEVVSENRKWRVQSFNFRP